MRSTPNQMALDKLRQTILTADFEKQESAYESLQASSSQDFGYDLDAWQRWIDEDQARRLQEIEEQMKSYGVVAVDGMIDTSSENYKRYRADFNKRIQDGIDEIMKRKKGSASDEPES